MKKTKIQKSFEIDFGHRVWTQQLDENFSGISTCPCKLLHGHRGKFILELEGVVDPRTGMVVDFKNLDFIKKLINNLFDHKFLIDINDPFLDKQIRDWSVDSTCSILTNMNNVIAVQSQDIYNGCTHKEIMIQLMKSNPKLNKIAFTVNKDMKCADDEWLCSFTFCNFVPTAENISAAVLETIKNLMSPSIFAGVELTSVQFYETPTGSAIALP